MKNPKFDLQSLARALLPFLKPLLQETSGATVAAGTPSPHGLNSVHHSGALANSQAPQFLLLDGSRTLTGNLGVSAGVTIDGVDVSVHAADPNAHHNAVTLASPSGLQLSTQQLQLDDAIAGAGLVISSKVLAVGAGNGLTVNANDVALTTPGTLTVATTNNAASNHTHAVTSSSNPGAAASLLASNSSGYLRLERLGVGTNPSVPLHALATTEQLRLAYDASNYAAFTVGSGGNLTVAPTGDFVFDPTGNDILPNTNYDLNIGALNKKYLTLHAAELWVETLVAQNTIATIGGRILVGPTTTLIEDVTVLHTTIRVKHNQMASGDRVYMEADGKVEFMAITSGASVVTGGYEYSVTRNLDGSGINQWFAGDAVFNTGTTGDGFIDIYSVQGVSAGSSAGPTIVGNVRDSSTYNDWTEHWAIGNLNGLYGYGVDTYGVGLGKFGTGNQSYITMDPTNGIRFFWGSTVVGKWEVGGDVIFGEVATNKANLFWDQSAGRLNVRGGASGTATEAYIDSDGTITAGGGTVLLNSDGVSIESDAQAPANVWNFTAATTDALRFVDGSGNVLGWLFSNYESTSKRQLYLRNEPGGSDAGEIYIQARGNSAASLAFIGASYAGTSAGPGILIEGGSSTTTSFITMGAVNYVNISEGDLLLTDGSIFVGDTANTGMTVGLTINQGANDNLIQSWKSSDVAHGITDVAETDDFGNVLKAVAASGGVRFAGFTEDKNALELYGYYTNDDTARATTSVGAVVVNARKKSGTGSGAPGANANLFVVMAGGNARFLVDNEGDIHMDATSNINAWDEHDDIALLAGVREAMNPGLQLSEFVDEARPVLERTGVVTYNPDGHHFISLKKLHALEIDAVRQLHQRIERLERELEAFR